MLILLAAGDAAEEDDLLGLEALDDEVRDGLDGFAVEGVFDDAHRFSIARRGFGVAGRLGVHGGKDKRIWRDGDQWRLFGRLRTSALGMREWTGWQVALGLIMALGPG